MASKKDKFGKKVRRSLKKSLGEAPASDKASSKKPDSKQVSVEENSKSVSLGSAKQGQARPKTSKSASTQKKPSSKETTSKEAKPEPASPKAPVLDSFALHGVSPARKGASDWEKTGKDGKEKKASADWTAKASRGKNVEKDNPIKNKQSFQSQKARQGHATRPNETLGAQKTQDWIQVETEKEFGLPRGSHEEKSQKSYEEKPIRRESTMPRNRDSIYNVSTDIRLEDYTEDSGQERDYAGMARFAAGVLLVALLAWGGYEFAGLLFRPDYQIAITNEEVDAGAVEALDKKENIVLAADRPVFIRFQWPEGALTSDYLRIRVLSAGREVAVMGRMAPVTVNYILFAGSLEPGKYEIVVENRDGSPFLSRKVTIR